MFLINVVLHGVHCTGTDSVLGLEPSKEARLLVLLSPVYSTYMPLDRGPAVLLCDPRVVRAWPGGCGYTKMGANYAPSFHPQRIAESQGCVQESATIAYLHYSPK